MRMGSVKAYDIFQNVKEDVFVSFGLVQGISLLAFGIFFVMRPEAIAVFFWNSYCHNNYY